MRSECLKRTYSTKGYAKAALKRAGKRGNTFGTGAPKQLYFCKRCGGYHLTKEPKPKDVITSQRARQVI